MCLKYIGERESANEGFGYKELVNTGGYNHSQLATAQMNYPVITDTWLLHKEPKECAYRTCCFKSLNDYRSYRNRDRLTTYNHGFHLWKVAPPDRGYSSLNRRTYKVYYKDIIAEDDAQIVAKQIYICDKTTHPNQSLVKQEEPKYESIIEK